MAGGNEYYALLQTSVAIDDRHELEALIMWGTEALRIQQNVR